MERYIGRIWMGMLAGVLAVVVLAQGDALTPIEIPEGEAPFRTALVQLGILYIVALFVERSLEVLIKAWRQGEKTRLEEETRSAEESGRAAAQKKLQEYKAGTQRRALLVGFDAGNPGIAVRGPTAWPNLRVRRRRGVVSARCVPVHGHYLDGRPDSRRIGDNPRADGSDRRFPEDQPKAREAILKPSRRTKRSWRSYSAGKCRNRVRVFPGSPDRPVLDRVARGR